MYLVLRNISPHIAGAVIITLFTLLVAAIPAEAQNSEELQWHSFEDALAIADSSGRPLFVDVWAPWCGWCRKMKNDVYPALQEELKNNFILTRLNRDDSNTSINYRGRRTTPIKLAQFFDIPNVPAAVILNRKGRHLLHTSGFLEADKLLPVLKYISTEDYANKSYEQFMRGR